MKKMVKESLNEDECYPGYGKKDLYESKKETPLNQHVYKMLRVKVNQLEEIKEYCQKIINESGEVLERLYDEGGSRDEDECEMIANNEGRIEVAQNIIEILKKL